jgi:diketogulonate reductase-like aldo/keto reductase
MPELEYHPYLLSHLAPVLDIHAKHGIVAEAYGPLTPVIRHPGGPLKPVLEKIAKAHDVDTATVLLRWTIQSGVVAVTSSKNEERIKGYTKLWEFELSPEEVKEIEEAGKKVHFRYYAVSTPFRLG